MSEQLYFFKLDKKKIAENLLPLISGKLEVSFQKYLEENYSSFLNDTLSSKVIIEKVKNRIGSLSEQEFDSIVLWMGEMFKGVEFPMEIIDEHDLLDSYGIEYIYEIPNTSWVRMFHKIMLYYECETDQDFKCVCSVEEMLNFLNFGICYSGEMEIFMYPDNDTLDVREKIQKIILSEGNSIYESALSQFDVIIKENSEYIKLFPQFLKNGINEREKDVEAAFDKFNMQAQISYIFEKIKDEIENDDRMIARIHSY